MICLEVSGLAILNLKPEEVGGKLLNYHLHYIIFKSMGMIPNFCIFLKIFLSVVAYFLEVVHHYGQFESLKTLIAENVDTSPYVAAILQHEIVIS